ncbi:MAG: hypothetical protein H0W83_09360, partial [Planctomycetes bacterium]|nr:hypothetical protein [Planctomycetota bacterium]
LITASPRHLLAAERERLEDARTALRQAMARGVETARTRLAAQAGHLDALSPLGVISRGYSVVRTPDGRLVRRTGDAPPGTVVEARLVDGWLSARVEGSRAQKLNEPADDYTP